MIRIVIGVAVGLILALYIGLPVTMAAFSVWPSTAAVEAAPSGFENAELTTPDSVKLAAWYAPSKNGAAVILVHGAGGSREQMRPLARTLSERGYGVLALDTRGHGESGGKTNRFGWMGTQDVCAAVEFLREQDPALQIGAVGYSMGGEVLLGAAAECPEIHAIVADGATRRSTAELLALPSERSIVRNFTARVMFAAVRLFSWETPPPPLLDAMRRAQATRFLLVAAGAADLEPEFNREFVRTVGPRAEVWVAPGVGHLGARGRYPQEYDQRVIGFLDEQLLP